VATVDYKVMRSRSTTAPGVVAGHQGRSRSNPRRAVVRTAGERAALSDVGLRRAVNQDAFFSSARLLATADGVGGGPGGEVAAGLAVDALAAGVATARTATDLRLLASDASAAVYDAAHGAPSLTGMATTLTAALFVPQGLAVVHAGDSRLYRLRDGALDQLTTDHSVVDQLLREGLIAPERAATHPLRNMITRALGRDRDTDFDAFVVPVRSGDVFLLCTDGLTKMVGERAIAAEIDAADSLDDAALRLVRAANAAGGSDNVTVVLAAPPSRSVELRDDAAAAA
jgi:serine/threonine protein phosphatase PrpC